MTRVIDTVYRDPLDEVWLAAASRMGFRIERSSEVYASTDGRGVIVIASPETMDADDSLAQMIFHELCHSLVQGRQSLTQVDWGLDNETDEDVPREHACLRLQAALADRYGLRYVLAPTTDHRAFYDALPADPFLPGREPTSVLARKALQRAQTAPWAPHLTDALAVTALIVRTVAAATAGRPENQSIFPRVREPDLHAVADLARNADTCGSCAWRVAATGRCTQHGRKVAADLPACVRWEGALQCQDCGACCREAYTAVEVRPREPAAEKLAHLIVRDGRHRYLLREEGGRCVALSGGQGQSEPFVCSVYEDRPRNCRDFELGGTNCLSARRAVGLSR